MLRKHWVKYFRNSVARERNICCGDKRFLKKFRNIFCCSKAKNVSATTLFPLLANGETIGNNVFLTLFGLGGWGGGGSTRADFEC